MRFLFIIFKKFDVGVVLEFKSPLLKPKLEIKLNEFLI
jgi:hypothetical protein